MTQPNRDQYRYMDPAVVRQAKLVGRNTRQTLERVLEAARRLEALDENHCSYDSYESAVTELNKLGLRMTRPGAAIEAITKPEGERQ